MWEAKRLHFIDEPGASLLSTLVHEENWDAVTDGGELDFPLHPVRARYSRSAWRNDNVARVNACCDLGLNLHVRKFAAPRAAHDLLC